MTEPARQLDRAEPGFWRIRVVKGGPLVGACIRWCETTTDPDEPNNDMAGTRSPFLAAFINDKPVDIDRVWHTKGEVIDEPTYRFMVAEAVWATEYAPDEPIANPHRPIDLMTAKLPW